MKVYKVKVNGRVFEVELESVTETAGSVGAPTAAAPAAAPVASGAGNKIVTPIAGKVLDIKVKVGDVVKKGQTVAVVEAMKLENEVPSAFDGRVAEIVAQKGAQVNNQDVLIVLA